MGTSVNLSMKSMQEFADLFVTVSNNLVKTADVFEQIVVPSSKESGSDVLLAVADDVVQIKGELNERLKAARITADSIGEYVDKLNKINSN